MTSQVLQSCFDSYICVSRTFGYDKQFKNDEFRAEKPYHEPRPTGPRQEREWDHGKDMDPVPQREERYHGRGRGFEDEPKTQTSNDFRSTGVEENSQRGRDQSSQNLRNTGSSWDDAPRNEQRDRGGSNNNQSSRGFDTWDNPPQHQQKSVSSNWNSQNSQSQQKQESGGGGWDDTPIEEIRENSRSNRQQDHRSYDKRGYYQEPSQSQQRDQYADQRSSHVDHQSRDRNFQPSRDRSGFGYRESSERHSTWDASPSKSQVPKKADQDFDDGWGSNHQASRNVSNAKPQKADDGWGDLNDLPTSRISNFENPRQDTRSDFAGNRHSQRESERSHSQDQNVQNVQNAFSFTSTDLNYKKEDTEGPIKPALQKDNISGWGDFGDSNTKKNAPTNDGGGWSDSPQLKNTESRDNRQMATNERVSQSNAPEPKTAFEREGSKFQDSTDGWGNSVSQKSESPVKQSERSETAKYSKKDDDWNSGNSPAVVDDWNPGASAQGKHLTLLLSFFPHF